MDIYVEYVIIDNMVFDSLLLCATCLTLRAPLVWWRILLSSAVGTAIALLLPLLKWHIAAQICIKIVSLIAMIFILQGRSCVKKFIASTLLFSAYTFALGGCIIAMYYFGFDLQIKDLTAFYTAKIPLGAYVGSVALVAFLLYNLVVYLRFKRKNNSFYRKITLDLGGRNFSAVGYVDSGNTLEYDGIPVCFVLNAKFSRHISSAVADMLIFGDCPSARVAYDTVEGGSIATAVKCRLTVDGATSEIYLAYGFYRKTDYEILLNMKFS